MSFISLTHERKKERKKEKLLQQIILSCLIEKKNLYAVLNMQRENDIERFLGFASF